MANDFGTGKSILVIAIVAGCFAVLWPQVLFPMIQGLYSPKESITISKGCCDVIFDSDVNAIKVMVDICDKILLQSADINSKHIFALQQGKLTKDIVNKCQKTVFETCGVDIKQFLIDKVRLGKTYKQMLDEIRSLNSSFCLKQSFGVSLGDIGLPRTIRIWGLNKPKHLKQERPPHLRPELIHPALRERGRAIQKRNSDRSKSLPGMRPPMGGAGRVVPPPKTTGATMGILMPMYTVGILVFFLYTMMKLLFKKTEFPHPLELSSDPNFRSAVFDEQSYPEILEDHTKIGWRERDTRDSELDFLRKRLLETEKAMERISVMMSLPSQSRPEENENFILSALEMEVPDSIDYDNEIINLDEGNNDGKSIVKVLGMEMTESCEHGGKWSRPPTPLSRPSTPQNIFISGSLPSKSQLLVSESHIETVPAQDDAVVLTGKVTLSLIGLSENNAGTAGDGKNGPDKEPLCPDNASKEVLFMTSNDKTRNNKQPELSESNGNYLETVYSDENCEKKVEDDKPTKDGLNNGDYIEKQDSEEEIE